MAGIYIHIPFCKQACHYCNFHFSTQVRNKNDLIDALLKEIALRKHYLEGKTIETIYFGGGTPSLLDANDIEKIFEALHRNFSINALAEITLEANPDDLDEDKLTMLKNASVNRLSIGIQSFFDRDLKWMNRAHDGSQAMASVKRSQDKGFSNLSVDLIYGLPELTNDEWEQNLEKTFALEVQHISAYCLTVEPKTALYQFIQSGKSKNVDEERSAEQFEILMQRMRQHDFIHYEISNFCREDFYSRHNSNYWNSEWYLGIGPSAHSFNGKTRQWNVANNSQYVDSLRKNMIPFEIETLTPAQHVNEYIMTSLRTMWGCDLKRIEKDYGEGFLSEVSNNLQKVSSEFFHTQDQRIFLTEKGKLIADKIILELTVE